MAKKPMEETMTKVETPEQLDEAIGAAIAAGKRSPGELRGFAVGLANRMYEAEQARWQKAIDTVTVKMCPDRDGSGCDSGDPLDLTLTELRQAFSVHRDVVAALKGVVDCTDSQGGVFIPANGETMKAVRAALSSASELQR